jgi:hypothetical protein
MNKYAHAAGIFDVSGSLEIYKPANAKYSQLKIRLSASPKSFSVLEYLQGKFGGNVVCKEAVLGKKEWYICGNSAVEFLKSIYQYMQNKQRRKQAKFLIDNFFTHGKGYRYASHELRKKRTLERRINIFFNRKVS